MPERLLFGIYLHIRMKFNYCHRVYDTFSIEWRIQYPIKLFITKKKFILILIENLYELFCQPNLLSSSVELF